MAYMVMYVLDDPGLLDQVLDAWRAAGVSGTTIVESSGTHRREARRAGLHLRYPFEGREEYNLEDHYTLFSIVPDEALVQRCIEAVERVVGDLSGPHTGVLAAWPLAVVRGVPKNGPSGDSAP